MISLNILSDDEKMQIATLVSKDGGLKNEYYEIAKAMRESKKFNSKEKELFLKEWSKFGPSQSFENKFIGFH